MEDDRLSRAISASSRRKIIHLLNKERTVKEISQLTGMSVSLASRHLKLLYDLGFLSVRQSFPNKFYSLKIKEIKKLFSIYDQISMPDDDKLSRAINASSRRKIIQLLDKERTVKDISQLTGMSVSLTSRHLSLLYDLGFLKARKQFPNKFYSLKIKKLQSLMIMYDEVMDKL